MDTTTITLIVVAVVVALIVGGALGMAIGSRQRTKRLQKTFGPEYEHAVNEFGDKRQAEQELQARLEHVKKLEIRPLSGEEINRFTDNWLTTQAEFVDDPAESVRNADRLIGEVLKAKGYPVEDFEQGAADISVSYPDLVMDYRGLHSIAVRSVDESIATEQIRQAMLHGRDLFENLIENDEHREENPTEVVAEVVEEPDEKEKVS